MVSDHRLSFWVMTTVQQPLALRFGVIQADLHNSDHTTLKTIRLMSRLVRSCLDDPLVKQTARQAVAQFGADPLYAGDPERARAAACFWWAKHYVKVMPHDRFKALVAAYPEKRQVLIAPGDLLRLSDRKGDCSTFTLLLCALLESLGVRTEFVSVAVEPDEPTLYSHVYARAVLPDGTRLPLDASHGRYPGWEVPAADVFRKQVWDGEGEPIPDQAVRAKWLNAYMPRRGMGRYRGMGQGICLTVDPATGDCTQYDTSSLLTIDSLPTTPYTPPGSSVPLTFQPAAAIQPAAGPTWYDSLFANLANQWTQIGSRVVAPTTTVTQGPQGTSISTPAGSTAAASLLSGSAFTTSNITGWLLIGGLLIGGVVLVKSLSK